MQSNSFRDGRFDFIHRTFQEYLAGRAAVSDADDIGSLITNAHLDQWHETVVMAAGHASKRQREELLKGLLERGDSGKRNRNSVYLLALACLETVPELSPSLRERIQRNAAILLPPKSMSAAKAFSAAGEFVVDLLLATDPKNARESAATVRAAAEIGIPEMLPLLKRLSRDGRSGTQEELLSAWPRFDIEIYAREVLADLPIDALSLNDADLAAVTRHLKRLESLACPIPLSGNLDFVPGQIKQLDLTGDLFQLDTLSTPDLTGLSLRSRRRTRAVTLDLSALAAFHHLTRLEVSHPRMSGLRKLNQLRELRALRLSYGVDFQELWSLDPGWQLNELMLVNIESPRDLKFISHLRGLNSVVLSGCRNLRTLAGCEKWAQSIMRLTVRNCKEVDLAPVASLRKLEEIDLYGTTVKDLSPIVELPNLRRLTISSPRSGRDIVALRRLPRLRELRIGVGGPIELSGLSGMSDLRVVIEGGSPVRGVNKLGKDVKVERLETMNYGNSTPKLIEHPQFIPSALAG